MSQTQTQTRTKIKTQGTSAGVPGSAIQSMFQRVFASLRAGLSFDGARNLYKVYGYPRVLTAEDLLAKYERQDITSRITDAPPDETWAYPPEIVTDEKPFIKAWDTFINTQVFDLWPTLRQADKLLSFGQFSALWIGLPGEPPNPAASNYRASEVVYMQAYGGLNVTVDRWEIDKTTPRYGRPLVYQLRTTDSALADRVHFSRVVHIVDNPLQGQTFSIPRLNQVYNLLDDILKIGGGSAETYWLTANRGLQVDVDKDMDLKEDDATALSDELDEFQHQLRRYIRTRGVKIKSLGSEVADPQGVFGVLIALLSATTGIPQRILMGAEAGQLASAQDRANWAEYIAKRRINFAEPYVLRPLVARLQALGILPRTTKPIGFKWPSAFHQSPLEEAQTSAQFARSVVNLSRQTQYGSPVATPEECRRAVGLPTSPKNGEFLPPAFVSKQATKPAPAKGQGQEQGQEPPKPTKGSQSSSAAS